MKQVGFGDASARRWPVHGANKPDGAWTFIDPDGTSSVALFSGKMGTSRQMAAAINTAAEYQTNIGRIESIGAAFGVTFPEKGDERFGLYVLRSKWHPFRSYALRSIEEVASTIRDVLARKPPTPEHSESMMIRLLRSAVTEVSQGFKSDAAEQLTGIFGVNNPLFATILPVGERDLPSEVDALNASSYLLVNQLLFYYFLSSYEDLKLEKIDPETTAPQAIHPQYFRQVLKIDYKPVFEFDIAKHLDPVRGKHAIRNVLNSFSQVQAHQVTSDVIGKIFHNLIPLEKRKPVAAYYTNSNAGHLLAHLVVSNEFDTVMDPACGSGTMLVSAYIVKKELYERGGRSIDVSVHEKFVGEQLTGIDIMPFSGHLAVVNLSLKAPEHVLQRVRVAIHDSLELRPGEMVESSRRMFLRASRLGHRSILSYGDEAEAMEEGGLQGDFVVDKVDAILMNPPFSDSERIPRSYKDSLVERFGEGWTKNLLRGKYSLQLPFLLLAHGFLRDKGRVGAVLPITTLTGDAFRPWVAKLVSDYCVKAVIVGLGRTAFSENTALTECLLIATKKTPGASEKFALVGVEAPPPSWTEDLIHELAHAINSQAEIGSPGKYVIRLFEQSRLDPEVEGLQALTQRLHPSMSLAMDALDEVVARGITLEELEKKTGLTFHADALASKEQEGPQGRGLEFYCAPAITYFVNHEDAKKGTDRFIVVDKQADRYIVRDRVAGETFKVPAEKLIPFARRIAGIRSIDGTKGLNFIVKEYFKGLEKLVDHIVSTTPGIFKGRRDLDPREVFLARLKERWPRRVAEGRGRIWMARKIDFSASGTSVIACYSDQQPFIGPHWVINFPGNLRWMEKAFVLYVNSTLFFSQLLSKRTETRGAWGRIDKKKIRKLRVPDFSTLTDDQKLQIEALFRKVATSDLPSLLEQLDQHDPRRREIDDFFVKLMHPATPVARRSELLRQLEDAIVERLTQMKRAMESG